MIAPWALVSGLLAVLCICVVKALHGKDEKFPDAQALLF